MTAAYVASVSIELRSLVSITEDHPNRRAGEVELLPQPVLKIAPVGEMNQCPVVDEEHESRRVGRGLCRVKKAQALALAPGRRMLDNSPLDGAVQLSRGEADLAGFAGGDRQREELIDALAGARRDETDGRPGCEA